MRLRSPQIITGEIAAGSSSFNWVSDSSVGVSVAATGIYDLTLPAGYRLVSATAMTTGAFVASIISGVGTTHRITTFNSTTGASGNVAVRFVAVRM